ncbi:MAG: DUF192 domain-containing protein [Candidatus Hydrothermarchaeaceae archaeon]
MKRLITSKSSKSRLYLSFALIPVIMSGMCLSQKLPAEDLKTAPLDALYLEDGKVISLEISRTSEERRKGLMSREGIGEKEGMLFIFEEGGLPKIWMKNMKFPIDILWMDSEFRVVHIESNVPPCKDAPCPIYGSKNPADYVLEVKANLVEEEGIEVGDVLNIIYMLNVPRNKI